MVRRRGLTCRGSGRTTSAVVKGSSPSTQGTCTRGAGWKTSKVSMPTWVGVAWMGGGWMSIKERIEETGHMFVPSPNSSHTRFPPLWYFG